MITGIIQIDIAIFILFFMGLVYGYGIGKRNKFKIYKYYQEDMGLYIKLLALSFLVALIPFIKILLDKETSMEDGFFFMYLIYLLLFKITDEVSRIINKRPMRVTSKGAGGSWLDGILTVILIFSSIFLPLPLGDYFFR